MAPERPRLYVERAIKREEYPEDVTGAVAFLLSDAADFITSQTMAINRSFVLH